MVVMSKGVFMTSSRRGAIDVILGHVLLALTQKAQSREPRCDNLHREWSAKMNDEGASSSSVSPRRNDGGYPGVALGNAAVDPRINLVREPSVPVLAEFDVPRKFSGLHEAIKVRPTVFDASCS
jgi:hypothetical protein